jgi:sugar-specific transcriptional regulator TrmB
MNKDILKEIGLSEYETDIYLSLLENGEISAYVLADKTGMYRQATYDALNRLMEKGFVSAIKEGKSQSFKAVNPEIILEYLNEKTESFRSILPELNEMQKKSKSSIIVETYKGRDVLRVYFKDIINVLNKGGELLCTAVDEGLAHFGSRYWKTIVEQYERDMFKLGIKEKVMIKRGGAKLFMKGTTTYRIIPDKYFNPNPTCIYGNTVSIFIWGNPCNLIIIRSKEVADSYRKQFELMWKLTKPA